jgi:hypothetical protein
VYNSCWGAEDAVRGQKPRDGLVGRTFRGRRSRGQWLLDLSAGLGGQWDYEGLTDFARLEGFAVAGGQHGIRRGDVG